uniref:Zinc finger matrin-type 4 n=1 Tax=Paramormyrops kingsleyae TaxID=1676925 RepID=A0A3B3QFH4_9TELE
MKSTGGEEGLFTDSYCKVCSAQLISQSQRVAHYESRKHANKVRLYHMLHPADGGCPAKKLRTDNGGADGDVDRNKCCTLCNMSFTSAVVAQSHYQGKIHAKRLRLHLGAQASLSETAAGLKRCHSCELCSVTLNSAAQYHAHLQGSKHQNK